MYLKDHPAYVGQVKSHRFNYQVESWETDPATGINRKIIKKAERNTSCIALDYTIIEAMGIDLEKFKSAEEPQAEKYDPEILSAHGYEEKELPF
jgi:hypothetical protein